MNILLNAALERQLQAADGLIFDCDDSGLVFRAAPHALHIKSILNRQCPS